MKISRFKQLFLISGLTGIFILFDGRSAHADSLDIFPPNPQATELSSALSPLSAKTVPLPGTVATSAIGLQTKLLTAQTIAQTSDTIPGTVQPTPGTTPQTIQPTPGATPGTVETTPQTTPGTVQTTPDTTPGTVQSIPGTTPQTIQPSPGTTPGTVETTPQTTPGTMQTTPDTAPGTVQTTPETTPRPVQPATGTTPEAAPSQTITPGRATLSGPSYVGIGGNIGFGGSTDLGRGSFTIFSKIGLTNNISARPAININEDPTILLPVTLDFPFRSVIDGRISVAPYIGGGIVISTGSDSVVRALITGGVDVPITNQFTANANVSVGFFGNTEVGLRLGVGYNF